MENNIIDEKLIGNENNIVFYTDDEDNINIEVILQNENVLLNVESLTKLFIVDSKIVIFVYDITQKKSFEELDYWVKLTKEASGEYPVYALFGNKKDLYLDEEVDEDEGKKKSEEIGAYFKLTSAKTERENLNEYINELVKMFISKNNDNSETYHREESFTLQMRKKKKKKEGCCEKS